MKIELCDYCGKQNKGHNFANGFIMDFDQPDLHTKQPLKIMLQVHDCGQQGCCAGITIYSRSDPNLCHSCIVKIIEHGNTTIRPPV